MPLLTDLWRYLVLERPRRARRAVDSSAALFLTERGTPYSDKAIEKVFWRLGQRVGFPVTPHMLRHMYATYTLHALRERGFKGDALLTHPWPESSARRLAGIAALDHTSPSTKLIPPPVVERLFQGALDLIDRADAILDERDQNGPWRQPDLVPLRSACYVILGLTSGCRNHELASIEEGAVRQTTHDGEVFYWLKGVSLKTHCGTTEWMIPEIGNRCVRILERWAVPLRDELCHRLAGIDRELASVPRDSVHHTALLNERRRLEADRYRLFLGQANGRVGPISRRRSGQKPARVAPSTLDTERLERKRLVALLRDARERLKAVEKDVARIASENARLVTENAVLKAKLTSRNVLNLVPISLTPPTSAQNARTRVR